MDFYTLLGVSRSASSSDIKAAFRKKAVEHHPDKCASWQVFAEAGAAFVVPAALQCSETAATRQACRRGGA